MLGVTTDGLGNDPVMADAITDLTDDSIRTVWPKHAAAAGADDPTDDPSPAGDDDGTDGADDDASDADEDGTDA
jgi:hypothetical protein